MKPGHRNLITDVDGLLVGNAHHPSAATGVTVLRKDPSSGQSFTAALDIRGGGPATRDADPLALTSTVEEAHAIVLSGGSGLGLDAAGAVQTVLRQEGIGLDIAGQTIPIVPQAILFDMANGGDKNWPEEGPHRRLATEAIGNAATDFDLGSFGSGFGATTGDLRGGLGSASSVTNTGLTVGAIVAVNAVGSVLFPGTPNFLAAPFEQGDEFGSLGFPASVDPARLPATKGPTPGAATTIAVIATDATLTKVQTHRLAVMAQTGLPRAIQPAHTPFDGDLVFALSTGEKPAPVNAADLMQLGHIAAATLSRAIARGVFAAAPTPEHLSMPPSYSQKFAAS